MTIRGSVIALDPGVKRTGFAVVDPLRVTVEPLDVFHGPEAGEELLDHLDGLVSERTVEALLVGLPLGPDGGDTERSRAIRALCERLEARFVDLEVIPYDERLTTKEAEARLVEAGHTGSDRKARKDSWSAAVLLEDWIGSGEPRP